MTQILTTERLILRELEPGDLDGPADTDEVEMAA